MESETASRNRAHRGRRRRQRRLAIIRFLLIVAIGLPLLGAGGAAGYYFFSSWRARDLAVKAKENFERGNLRLAWLQISSAKDLRADDPEVLRAAALIDAGFGRPEALDNLEKLGEKAQLSPEELEARAEAAMRHGTDGQFEQAVSALAEAGKAARAGQLRAARDLRGGDLDSAIVEMRKTAAETGDAASKLSLARLLVDRYGPEFGGGRNPSGEALSARAEMPGLVDAAASGAPGEEAHAFALSSPLFGPEDKLRWAKVVMGNPRVESPALLPAAAFLVESGETPPAEIHKQLRPLFDSAPLDQRALLAQLLAASGLPKEALGLITAQESMQSTTAFAARAEAMLRLGNAEGVIASAKSPGSATADVVSTLKARAYYQRGLDPKGGAGALREAMDAAAKTGRLDLVLATGDSLDASRVVDEKLIELCADSSTAEYAFGTALVRFSSRGQPAMLSSAAQRARRAAPESARVQDYARYDDIINDRAVDLEKTASAVAASPGNVSVRLTHALNLLKNGQPDKAMAAFDDVTIFADRLTPGQLAVLAAVLAANGDDPRALTVSRALDPDLLQPGEYKLIAPLRARADGR